MNLKKQYQRLFEGRKKDYFDLLEAPMRQAFPRMKTAAEKQAAGVVDRKYENPDLEPLDIEYFSDELNTVLETIDEFHQELGTQVELKGDATADYQYETMEKQLSRYLEGAKTQLVNLQKYLERQKGKGL